MYLIKANPQEPALPLLAIDAESLPAYLAQASEYERNYLGSNGFAAQPCTWCSVPGADGRIAKILVGVSRPTHLYSFAHLPLQLPEGTYRLEANAAQIDPTDAALGFALGGYQFNRYRNRKREPSRLHMPSGVNSDEIANLVEATYLVRDLVNTPAEDMGPQQLSETVAKLAARFGASFREWIGDELLSNFPAVHIVGRAGHQAPRLLELQWGEETWPKITLVGKGVCFDTGGLDLKAADFMRWMKKDMGGAAHAIALAQLIMARRLPVRLSLLVPAVENHVAANAFRPGDVITTRKGIRVEIDNTDAEGRLVLCEALAYAAESTPKLILDFATLTGAARIALGPDLPALFTRDEAIAARLLGCAKSAQDPLWQLPLWQPYQSMLDSSIADCANSGPSRHAGAITAALFLERFVPPSVAWTHLDVYAWNDIDRPGRPKGGEAQGLRAFYAFLLSQFGETR